MKITSFHKYLFLLLTCLVSVALSPVQAQVITTIANVSLSDGYGGDNGPAAYAKFGVLGGMAIDKEGNLYIADNSNSRVRKMDPFGIVTTFAGTGVAGYSGDGGLATKAQLNFPSFVAVDDQGNVYISDAKNNRVRKVDKDGNISTVVGNGVRGYGGDSSQAIHAEINNPQGLAFDPAGNLYVCGDLVVRRIDTFGIITTYAGIGSTGYNGDGGPATTATFIEPVGIAIDKNFNLYIADRSCHVIRKVDAAGIITTFAGRRSFTASSPLGDGGPAIHAVMSLPTDIKLDKLGNMYITDEYNRLRKIDTTGIITTFAGTGKQGHSGDGGEAVDALLYSPVTVAVDNDGNFYVSETAHDIRFIFGSTPLNTFCKLYPNPTYNGQLTCLFTSAYEENVTVQIVNQAGQVVYKNTIPTNFNLAIRLEPTGIYFLTARSAHSRWKEEISVVR